MTSLIAFCDEMTALVDERRPVDVVYLNVSKVLTLSPKTLIGRLLIYGLDEKTVKLVKNWLND